VLLLGRIFSSLPLKGELLMQEAAHEEPNGAVSESGHALRQFEEPLPDFVEFLPGDRKSLWRAPYPSTHKTARQRR